MRGNSGKSESPVLCEGHLDHGIAAPWIDVGAPDIDELGPKAVARVRILQKQMDEEHLSVDEKKACRVQNPLVLEHKRILIRLQGL